MSSQALRVRPPGSTYNQPSASIGAANEIPIGAAQEGIFSRGVSPIKEVLDASNLSFAWTQIKQEAAMQLVPKSLISLFLRPKMILLEILTELPEYVFLYPLPPLIAAFGAYAIAKMLGKNFRLLGKPMHILEEHAKTGKALEIKGVKHQITQPMLKSLAFGKLMVFSLVIAAGACLQLIAAAPRALWTKHFTGTANFDAISNLSVQADEATETKASKEAEANAKKNMWLGFAGLGAAIPALLGLAAILNRKVDKFNGSKLIQASRVIDLGPNFDLSTTANLASLAVAPYAYMSTALSQSGAKEDFLRLLCFTIPAQLFFHGFIQNPLILGLGLATGIGNPLYLPEKHFENIKLGKKQIFDLSFYDKEHVKQMPSFKKLSAQQQEKFFVRAEKLQRWGAPVMALLWGSIIQVVNFYNTARAHDEKIQKATSQKGGQNLKLVYLGGLTQPQGALATA
jgi:hypothetical protein